MKTSQIWAMGRTLQQWHQQYLNRGHKMPDNANNRPIEKISNKSKYTKGTNVNAQAANIMLCSPNSVIGKRSIKLLSFMNSFILIIISTLT